MTYNAEIKIITPLIVHTGEYYDFINVIPLQNSEVAIINTEKLFLTMPEEKQAEFFSLIDNNKALEARKIFYEIWLKHTELAEKKYKASELFNAEIIKNPYANINKIFINNINGKPYIPGSSIKGALRTAILENLRIKNKINHKNKKVNDFEMQLITNDEKARFKVQDDPFKYLKISDFEIDDKEIRFGTVRIIGKDNQGKGIPIYTEMTNSELFSNKEVTAKGTININEERIKKENLHFLNIKEIIKSTDAFFKGLVSNKRQGFTKEINDKINIHYYDDTALLRIGRFCQIESKTFKIKRENEFTYIRGKKVLIPEDININGGVSRSLIDGKIPAGWGVFSILD